jgi:15-cis-phytoene desaturase
LQTDVLIIGGGIAGLACAVALTGSGLRVTVLEKTATLGGRAQSWVDPESKDVVDIGPHILLTEYQNMLALLDVLGTSDRIVWHTEKLITLLENRRATVMKGYPLTPPLHLVPSLLKVGTLSTRDKLSNARAAWLAMKIDERDVPALDELSAIDLLKRLRVSQRFIDWFWKTASMALMNVPLEECSAGALLRFYGQFLGHNGYSIGFPDCGLGEMFVPPALRVIRANGGAVEMNSAVRALAQQGRHCTGALLADGTQVTAKFCVSTLPPAALREVLPSEWRELPELRNVSAFKPSPYVSVYLWFDRKLTREKFWARVWSPEKPQLRFL